MFVVYGGRGIHYGWIVKRGYIFVQVGKRTRVGNRPSHTCFSCAFFWSGVVEAKGKNWDSH